MTILPYIAIVSLLFLLANLNAFEAKTISGYNSAIIEDIQGSRWERSFEDDQDQSILHAKSSHDHDQHECSITDQDLSIKFTKLSEEINLVDSSGHLCKEVGEEATPTVTNLTLLSCDTVFGFIQQLLVDLEVTTHCCLGNGSTCNSEITDPAKAYGYGFLMVFFVSLLSLLGVILLPLLKNGGSCYLYTNALMIALGTSALFCSAVLHLIPRALQLSEEEEKAFIWKGIVIIGGLYLLYLFEVTLHTWNNHGHTHHHHKVSVAEDNKPILEQGTTAGDEQNVSSASDHQVKNETTPLITKRGCFPSIKPLAWTIIFGDAFHNFADGLTIGAAISQSLSLGLSTTLAIALHEIPHELGDFVILLSTGLKWPVALLFNFLSSLTAVVGFFVGVTIGTSSVESNNWILTAAVGLFLYVALVDLLPELIHSDEKGCKRFIVILMTNIGFWISFVILLLIAVYEDVFDHLIEIDY